MQPAIALLSVVKCIIKRPVDGVGGVCSGQIDNLPGMITLSRW